ncbi:hypothetical protein BDQ12DRAFT_630217 [Crucibulum laeve]|uniref:RNA polymerase II-associated protein 3 n=1 Tax=Crucibulum laeve TaxID=68775 RepID=A0A5C3M1N8_9AGAR|nr:hypothetical protein BDQ12DRAFT_630217 [Crucibulum laeve]
MDSSKAQTAKEKGNSAFKAGDYPGAIGHYTTAILSNRNDPTFPLNRAAAYLKLGKNEDAERDCSTVLSLNPKNTKALFRRGQARVDMGRLIDAQRDFTEALRIEPTNDSVKAELKKVAELIEKEKQKKTKTGVVATVLASLAPEIAPKRRRVPIMVVEPDGSSYMASTASTSSASQPERAPSVKQSPKAPKVGKKVEEERLKPVSTRKLEKSPNITSPPSSATQPKSASEPLSDAAAALRSGQATPPKATSFKDVKQVRNNTKPSRVGGGIFRPSGNNTIFPERHLPSTSSPVPPAAPKLPQATALATMPTAAPLQSQPPAPSLPATTMTPELLTADAASPKPEEKMDMDLPKQPVGNPKPVQPPATLFDLVRAWASSTSNTERWLLITSIPPSKLPEFCKTSLEPMLLVSILETFLAMLEGSNDSNMTLLIKQYMECFAKVPRIGVLILFLSKNEKSIAKQVWYRLGVEAPTGVWSAVNS